MKMYNNRDREIEARINSEIDHGKTSYTVCPFGDEAPKSFKSFAQAKQYARENYNVVGYLIKITNGEGM